MLKKKRTKEKIVKLKAFATLPLELHTSGWWDCKSKVKQASVKRENKKEGG